MNSTHSAVPTRHEEAIRLFLALAVLVSVWSIPTPAQGSDTSTRWEHFSESSTCSAPYTKTPYVSRVGYLSNAEQILGPFGTYFGRSIAQVRTQLVLWAVPFSGGKRVLVHSSALPAFKRVAAGLTAQAAAGRVYPITLASAFTPRTIGGEYQMSRHAIGIAIDINYPKNPYRADGKLVTDMPQWFVKVWRDSGFCWGGDWRNAKDPMHFSWIGPGAGGGSHPELLPLPPKTSIRSFGAASESRATALGPVLGQYVLVIADGTGNGAPDVVGLRKHPDGAVLDIASSNEGYGSCSIRRWFVPDGSFLGADHTLFLDVDGDSRQDLMVLNVTSSALEIQVATRRGEFEDGVSQTIPFSNDIAAATGADFDGDHRADLWLALDDGTLRIFRGPSWDSVLYSGVLPSGAPDLLAAADRDGGDTPELFALYDNVNGSRLEVLELQSNWVVEEALDIVDGGRKLVALGAGDYDGDGRADVQVLDDSGRLDSHLGNSATGRPASSWFIDPIFDCDDPIILDFDGRFFDDDSSVHRNGIEFMAERGITLGCNPPFNDRFCPRSVLTRAQAATFISRAIGLPPSSVDYFKDDDGHVLEGGNNRVAEAGITLGCNPPSNTSFCPDRRMTRAEIAAFIVRALNLPFTPTDYFRDDDGHILEGSINRLAAAGITVGCNPPTNDRFCPSGYLTRAEAATFFKRAFG